jgi:hypothetical protein
VIRLDARQDLNPLWGYGREDRQEHKSGTLLGIRAQFLRGVDHIWRHAL